MSDRQDMAAATESSASFEIVVGSEVGAGTEAHPTAVGHANSDSYSEPAHENRDHGVVSAFLSCSVVGSGEERALRSSPTVAATTLPVRNRMSTAEPTPVEHDRPLRTSPTSVPMHRHREARA